MAETLQLSLSTCRLHAKSNRHESKHFIVDLIWLNVDRKVVWHFEPHRNGRHTFARVDWITWISSIMKHLPRTRMCRPPHHIDCIHLVAIAKNHHSIEYFTWMGRNLRKTISGSTLLPYRSVPSLFVFCSWFLGNWFLSLLLLSL